MENPEYEASSAPEESTTLNRNRSFKSKQLVRSQAIRESQSPPRTSSPAVSVDDGGADTVTVTGTGNSSSGTGGTSTGSTAITVDAVEEKRRPVEIHITGGAWESGEQKARRRWPQYSRDLLSNGPRVACVAGCRSHNCRGQRRRNPCPTKQDSGISCPDECIDCSDFDHTGSSSNEVRKASSLDSDDSYCRCPERKDKPKTNSLSRTDSADDKLEPTGPELVSFIKETLNKNHRDRMTLLMIEKELHALVTDTGRCNYKFPCMTSYGRMLVHRVATMFQLTHHLDQGSKNSVTVSKSGTSGGRIPCTSFKQWCTVNFPPSSVRHQDSVHAKSILKRDTHSPDDANASSRAVERSKSLEQREKEYERVRRRIFSTDTCLQDESQWPWLQTGPVKLLTPDSGRNKLLKVQSLEGAGPPGAWRARGAVAKSHSFGGYGGSGEQPQPRQLSRQGDLASSSWRLSPSSSGYKTLSLRSTDSVTPSPTGGASPEPSSEAVVFAVAELACVPPGALVIHPQTGRPLTNPDGSVYHFDPQNPPVIYDNTYQEQKIQNCEKRRGRLEKQHSFIDTEAECRCDDGRSKCCCECRQHDACNNRASDKIPVPPEQKTTPIPSSPVKNRYEQTEQTNQVAPLEAAANHRPAYDAANRPVIEPANQQPDIPIQTFETANQIAAFEPNQRTEFEAVNQRPYESPNQRFENRTFEAPHQRPPSFDPSTNQRAAEAAATNQMPQMNQMTNQESVEAQYVQYNKFRTDEVTPPPQLVQNVMMPEAGVYNIMAQAKVTPVPVADPNLRPVSITNMLYPAPMAQGYPYVNQVRMEQPLQPMYQPMMEEQKLAPSPHTETFRIDPSYQYAYGCAACAGACLEPHQHQRPYSLGYTQLEQVLQQPYPVGNMLQHNVQHYPYPDAMQWGGPMMPVAPAKLLMHELCPVYPQYPYVYPQMIPQPYPYVQPVYPVGDKEHRPRRVGTLPPSQRGTPQPRDRRDSEIALKIQQIKEQMAQLNTQDKEKSGNGLLGNAPGTYNGRVGRPVNDETQLSSAARAIVNSIRSMQANTYQHDARRQMSDGYRERERRDERDDKRRPHRPMSPGNWCRRSPGPVHPGDLASSSWRLSPSSSGYKTLSLRSTDSVTPSPTGGASPEPSSEAVVFAVAELACVPPGALVIHPQTGRPLTNPDGSVYHFDPQNPPVIYDNTYQEQKIQNCEKRRGRLEKQHSFIDTEAECRCDDGRSKCCCECRQHDACNNRASDKIPVLPEQKTTPIPSSPVKNRYEQAEQTNQVAPLEAAANHMPAYDAANRPVIEPANQQPDIPIQTFETANQIAAYESNQRTEFEAVNQRPYESPNQRFENRTFEAPHQRPPSFDPSVNQRGAEAAATNQMPQMNQMTNQESVEAQYVQYNKFRTDEVTPPPQLVQNVMMPEAGVYNIMAQAKVTPVPVADPNLRPVSLTNMLFPAPMAQGYPYVNQVRMEQPLQPMYQPMMEEQKLAPSPHTETFRIDPSYQYAYGCAACAGACLEPHQHQRPYSLGYTQLEQVLQQPYPVGNMLQHNVQHCPYPDAMQWGGPMMPVAPAKLLMHELCPVYQQYPYVYPQMIPQPYPYVQPVYPVGDKEHRPRRVGTLPPSQRGTPQPRDRRDSEIALKIQQIKEQMAQLNTQDKEKSGNGLLGNAPGTYNGRVGRPVNDETQLSSAARAIVNSIRSMQANTYQHDARRQMSDGYRERERRDERDDKRRPHRPMSPGNWCRRSPGPVHPVLNHPRRPHPDTRNGRR